MTDILSAPSRTYPHLSESLRILEPFPNQAFRIETANADRVWARGEYDGRLDDAIHHAQLCARSIAERHELRYAHSDVFTEDGKCVYSVSCETRDRDEKPAR